MKPSDSEAPRAETIVAALIYLMTHYARTGCPRLALCVVRHIECVSAHPDAAPVIRQCIERGWSVKQRDLQDAAWLAALMVIGFVSIVVDLTVGFEVIGFEVIARLVTEH